MTWNVSSRRLGLLLALTFTVAACGDSGSEGGSGGSSGTGGSAGQGGSGGSASGGSGGAQGGSGGGGSGGSSTSGGSGGASSGGSGGTSTGGSGGTSTGGSSGEGGAGGSASGGSGGGGSAGSDAGSGDTGGPVDMPSSPTGPVNAGGVGEQLLVPLRHTPEPVPPLVQPECQEDPTAGFTEYQDSFVVQRPRNLAASERFKYENGIWEFFVNSSDQAHKPNNTTAPRTEARYSDIGTGEHIWSGDIMYENPSRTCVFQIHNVNSPIAIYLRVQGDRMFNLSSGQTILTGATGKWFNLKVAFNIQTRQVRTYINNCLKATSQAPNTASVNLWYFKHGVYTCDSGTCRAKAKNIKLYQKGSTDKFHTRSTYP